MVNPYDIGSFSFFELIDFFRGQANDFWFFAQNRSREISGFELFWELFLVGKLMVSHIVLNHASGNPNLFGQRDFFELSGYLIFRLLADRTGIKDNDFSFINTFYRLKATVF